MSKQFDILYVNENTELVKHNCLADDVKDAVNDLPEHIPVKSIICIKDSSWDDLI